MAEQFAVLRVEGLREFRNDLKAAGREGPRLLTKGHRQLAKNVGMKARGRARSLGGVAAKSAVAVGWRATSTSAAVILDSGFRGGRDFRFVFGAEFGSIQYSQFPPWRGNKEKAGYFLYPTLREELPKQEKEYIERISSILEGRARFFRGGF